MVKKLVKVTVVDQDGDVTEWSGSGCVVTVIDSNQTTKEVGGMNTGLIGRVSDHELLMMLRYTLDKMALTFDNPNIVGDGDITEILATMHDAMLADEKGKQLLNGTSTVQ
jgi:hypothetical protein